MALISERVTYNRFSDRAAAKGDLFFFLYNRFPDRAAAESASLFRWRRGGLVRMRTYIYIMKRWSAVSFSGVADRERMTGHPV